MFTYKQKYGNLQPDKNNDNMEKTIPRLLKAALLGFRTITMPKET